MTDDTDPAGPATIGRRYHFASPGRAGTRGAVDLVRRGYDASGAPQPLLGAHLYEVHLSQGLIRRHHRCYAFSMKATTVKVEGELLRELERVKPRSQSLSAYVRALLQKEVLRRKMAEAADRYTEFLRESPDERASLEEWVNADLSTRPTRRRR